MGLSRSSTWIRWMIVMEAWDMKIEIPVNESVTVILLSWKAIDSKKFGDRAKPPMAMLCLMSAVQSQSETEWQTAILLPPAIAIITSFYTMLLPSLPFLLSTFYPCLSWYLHMLILCFVLTRLSNFCFFFYFGCVWFSGKKKIKIKKK